MATIMYIDTEWSEKRDNHLIPHIFLPEGSVLATKGNGFGLQLY